MAGARSKPERPARFRGGASPRVALVTCRRWPALSPSDQRYAAALRDMGAEVVAAAWNAGSDQAAFQEADLVVLRGNWDYHDDVDGYRDWLARLGTEDVLLLNDPATVSRFLDKRTFAQLAGDDVMTPGCRVCPPEGEAIGRVLAAEGWERAVLKPVNGASGRGVQLVTPGTVKQALAAVVADVGVREMLVQEFVPEIAEGETQFVLFDGIMSHAVVKRPAEGEFRTNSAFSPIVELAAGRPVATERVEALVRRVAAGTLYARVDVAMRGSAPVLLELEVNEPGLWLDIAPPSAAEMFARATLARLRR